MSDQMSEKNGQPNGGVSGSSDSGKEQSGQEEASNSRKKEQIYALKFAAVICFVCCMLLTGASVGLKKFQIENIELDRQKNILKAAGVIDQEKSVSRSEIKKLFREKIEEIFVNSSGEVVKQLAENTGKGTAAEKSKEAPLPLYLYKENSSKESSSEGGANGAGTSGTDKSVVKAYIIPIESKGLWGKIYGYLAFESDGVTIAGFTVYSHSETPGLGGEIEKAWFQKNFVGKKVLNSQNKFVSVSIAKGSAENLPAEEKKNYVDGISGATLTGKYLTQGIKQNLEQYEGVSIKFRQGMGVL